MTFPAGGVGDQIPHLMNVQEAADVLRLSKYTLYEMVQQHRIPVIRVGRLLRFSLEELRAWWEAGGTAEAARFVMKRREGNKG